MPIVLIAAAGLLGFMLLSKSSNKGTAKAPAPTPAPQNPVVQGAGAVAAGGIISVFRALPLILSSIRAGLRDLSRIGSEASGAGQRTEREARAALKIIKAFIRDRERANPANRRPLPTASRKPHVPASKCSRSARKRTVKTTRRQRPIAPTPDPIPSSEPGEM